MEYISERQRVTLTKLAYLIEKHSAAEQQRALFEWKRQVAITKVLLSSLYARGSSFHSFAPRPSTRLNRKLPLAPHLRRVALEKGVCVLGLAECSAAE